MTRLKAAATGSVLEWARLSAGFTPEDAARKVSAATSPEKILAWESGEDHPTIPQLRKLADAYKRPLSLFFLPEPPRAFQPMHDFRRMPGEVANVYSPNLLRELRDAEQRRELAIDLLEDLDIEPRRFGLTATLNDSPEALSVTIREVLGVTVTEQTLSRNRGSSFSFWRKKLEAIGVLVFQIDRVDLSEMLGLSIADEVLPVVAVNRKNRRGRVFSALHEFAHLMLRLSGICDIEEDFQRPPEEQRVEIFCNSVAAAVLLPRDDFLDERIIVQKGSGRHDYSTEELDVLANRYGVSALVVMRRLLTLGKTTEAFYRAKQTAYRAIYARLDVESRAELPDELPRNIPQETVGKLGGEFIRLVLDNYHNERITLVEVSDYLGVRVKHIPKIEQHLRAG
jgi:Zn-dependent peptidase ImmA (M78 family)/transcriptional regulator with XRE-family HTH domain